MKRIALILLCCVMTPAAAYRAADPAQTRPPNIIFILADDLGWGE